MDETRLHSICRSSLKHTAFIRVTPPQQIAGIINKVTGMSNKLNIKKASSESKHNQCKFLATVKQQWLQFSSVNMTLLLGTRWYPNNCYSLSKNADAVMLLTKEKSSSSRSAVTGQVTLKVCAVSGEVLKGSWDGARQSVKAKE